MSPARGLTDAEIEIWRQVAETVVPRPGSRLPTRAVQQRGSPPDSPETRVAEPVVRNYFSASYTPPVSVPKPPPAGLERRYKRQVADGRIPVDAALDLHGLTQTQAHAALTRFLLATQREGGRLAIVVTGKGLKVRSRGDAVEPGVLRRVVPFWLRDPVLRSVVMSFEEAAGRHGGAGALYVRLRKSS